MKEHNARPGTAWPGQARPASPVSNQQCDAMICTGPPVTLCTNANVITTPGTCDGLMGFALTALGRRAVTDGSFSAKASGYPAPPATPNVLLDGSSTDAVHLGPATPPAGVMEYTFTRLGEPVDGGAPDGG